MKKVFISCLLILSACGQKEIKPNSPLLFKSNRVVMYVKALPISKEKFLKKYGHFNEYQDYKNKNVHVLSIGEITEAILDSISDSIIGTYIASSEISISDDRIKNRRFHAFEINPKLKFVIDRSRTKDVPWSFTDTLWVQDSDVRN